jgi:hypothetical protein
VASPKPTTRLSQAKEDEQRRQRSLSAQERDRQYRLLLTELTLHPDDRADLVRRGFSHQEIELSGFKSVGSYQQLQTEFSELLPGIGTGGKNLIVKHCGYLCPVRDADGLILACQIRLRGYLQGIAIVTDGYHQKNKPFTSTQQDSTLMPNYR